MAGLDVELESAKEGRVEGGRGEDGEDVFEEDTRLWEVWELAEGGTESGLEKGELVNVGVVEVHFCYYCRWMEFFLPFGCCYGMKDERSSFEVKSLGEVKLFSSLVGFTDVLCNAPLENPCEP